MEGCQGNQQSNQVCGPGHSLYHPPLPSPPLLPLSTAQPASLDGVPGTKSCKQIANIICTLPFTYKHHYVANHVNDTHKTDNDQFSQVHNHVCHHHCHGHHSCGHHRFGRDCHGLWPSCFLAVITVAVVGHVAVIVCGCNCQTPLSSGMYPPRHYITIPLKVNFRKGKNR